MRSRLFDVERRVGRPGGLAFCALLVAAGVWRSELRAADNGGDARLQAAAPAGGQSFALTVVGPDGKFLPGIPVKVESVPRVKVEAIREGAFRSHRPIGDMMQASPKGRLVVELPARLQAFYVLIEIPGFAPYETGWNPNIHPESMPAAFTAPLDAAWSVGAVVVDGDGAPVKGAKISLRVPYKRRPGDLGEFFVGTKPTTDAAGTWRYDSVPVSQGDVYVEVNQPAFMPARRYLTRAEFGLKPGAAPHAKVVLGHGLTVTGKVTDEAGKPIAQARIRTRFQSDVREAVTGADGVYHLGGCEPQMARIAVSAKGHATDMREVPIDQGMRPVDFQMKPGGTVRVRVIDEHGRPIAKARILVQEWRGHFQAFEFDLRTQYTDENGVWQWNEAPLDEFKADICRPGGMELSEQSLVARKQEYVFQPPDSLVVSGTVVDGETKRPIKSFRVVPGTRHSQRNRVGWNRLNAFTVSDGHYRLRERNGSFSYLIRIEADGYRPAVSREIKSNEGQITINFELARGQDVDAVVLTPDGRPASGAEVALGIDASIIYVTNGRIDANLPFAPRQQTDASGRFHFPPQAATFYLVIAHPSGYAEFQPTPQSNRRIINLDPWTRVEGTYRIGGKPQANVPIAIERQQRTVRGRGGPSVWTRDEVTTGPDGKFVFERVKAGSGWVGRRLVSLADGGARDAASACNVLTSFPLGKTVQVDLGGTGRPVVGRLSPAPTFKKEVPWKFATVGVEPIVRPSRVATTSFRATVGRDGAFRIDDMPAGDYVLNVWFTRYPAGQLWGHHFSVPPVAANLIPPPIDLGMLTLKKN